MLRASFGISTLSSHHIEPRVEEKLSEIEWIEQPEALKSITGPPSRSISKKACSKTSLMLTDAI